MSASAIPLILTRPAGSNERFIELCPPTLLARFRIILSPLIEIAGKNTTLDLGDANSVIFTSANGVRFAPDGQGKTAYCVGRATTLAASRAGWAARFSGVNADDLVAHINDHKPEGMVWHLSGVHTRGAVQERLLAAGVSVERAEIYDQRLISLTPDATDVLRRPETAIVPLFSPRTAAYFVTECPKDAHPFVVGLSAAVGEAVSELAVAGCEIAQSPEARAMWRAIEKTASGISLG